MYILGYRKSGRHIAKFVCSNLFVHRWIPEVTSKGDGPAWVAMEKLGCPCRVRIRRLVLLYDLHSSIQVFR